MKRASLCLVVVACLFAGCGEDAPKKSSGVEINAPGVNIKAGKGGAEIKAPGVGVKVNP